jgi:hypothetical protein
MSVNYLRDDARRLIRVTVTGPIALEDFIAVMDRQITEGVWSYGVLYDLSAMAWVPSSADIAATVEAVTRRGRLHGRRGPVALVTQIPVNVGMGRMYEIRDEAAGLDVQVFATVDAAERWLASSTQS